MKYQLGDTITQRYVVAAVAMEKGIACRMNKKFEARPLNTKTGQLVTCEVGITRKSMKKGERGFVFTGGAFKLEIDWSLER